MSRLADLDELIEVSEENKVVSLAVRNRSASHESAE